MWSYLQFHLLLLKHSVEYYGCSWKLICRFVKFLSQESCISVKNTSIRSTFVSPNKLPIFSTKMNNLLDLFCERNCLLKLLNGYLFSH